MKSTQKPFYILMVLALLAGMIGFQPAQPAEAALPTDLFISEYIEGSSYNKAIEIYNGTGMTVDLSDYQLEVYFNGSLSAAQTAVLSGLLASGDVFIVAHEDADNKISIKADLINSSLVNFNGDDAIALRKISTESLVDVFGQIGFDPGSFWSGDSVQTQNRTLVRKIDICAGDPIGSDLFNPSIEWDSYSEDTFDYLGSHTTTCAPDIFPERFIISEYVEGSDNNKAIELYNGTGEDIDLNGFVLQLYANTSPDPSNPLTWPANSILSNGEAYVITHPSAEPALLNLADKTSTVAYFNGNDSLVLRRVSDDAVMDSFGKITENPNGGWGSGDTYTVDHTLVRKANICSGDTDPNDTFDPALEYNGYATNTYSNLGSHTMTCGPGDQAPTVASTVPADGAANVAVDANIIITFSEPVTVTGDWYTIECTGSSTHTAAATGDNTVFTLNPVADFVTGETCEVIVLADKVTDDDTEDPPDTMEANYVFSFDTISVCGDGFTPIYEIQGSSLTSTLVGKTVTTEGVVVGDYQTGAYVSGTKNGFYIQDINGDEDPGTSDGIFIYSYMSDVLVGDHVRVTGNVAEYIPTGEYTESLTQISSVSQILTCDTGITVEPTVLALPVEDALEFESHEGMLVTIPQELTISEYYNFGRYGEIKATNSRFLQFTAVNEPDVTGYSQWVNNYFLNSITLDDGRTGQNPDPAYHPNGDEFTLENLFRGGDLVSDITGIFDHSYDLYRIQPRLDLGYFNATYTPVNTRPVDPEIIEGDLKVASFNVLNYFVTLDLGPDICGPLGNMECRGADSAEELTRQRDKILAALIEIDADVYGLMEIENDRLTGEGDAVADLVAGINAIAGTDTYAYIDTGAIGTDAIKQAIIYKPNSVTPVGDYHILDSSVDSRFIDTKNRPVIAQVFEDNETGEQFVVAVNHLKSKGSACDGDPDLGDGQGNCNLTRLAAAEALVDWLADTTKFPDAEKKLIIGDLNSYDKEDPIDAIKLGSDDTADTADDYLDMIFEKRGEYAYGYVYDGQTGYLDHALANQIMAESIVDVNFWHINADEPDLIDYDTSFKLSAQDALYAPDAYRSSDHDPVIVTLSRNNAPVGTDQSVTTSEDTPVNITLAATDQDGDALTYAIYEEPLNGIVTILDSAATYTPNADYIGTDSFTFKAFDGSLYSTPATVNITVTAVNDAPVAVDDAYTTNENEVLTIDAANGVLANDTDVDSEVLTAVLVDDVSNGTLALTDDGSFVYTPVENFLGSTTFTYKVSDGALESNIATVTITVNDPPVAEDNSATTDEDVAVGVTLLASDTEGNPLTYAVVAQPANGSVTLEGAVATYTPNPDYNGPDSFTFKANDGTVDSNVATITITINPVNDAPVLDPIGPQAGDEETLITFTATASDIDLPEQVLTFSLVDAPADAEIDQLTGVFTWTPTEAQGPGEFTFTVQVCDDDAVEPLCDTEEITVTVNEVNVDPVLDPIGAKAGDEGNPITFTATATDVDVPSQALTFSLTGTLPDGATISEAGVFTWTPTEAQGPGEFTFTVQVCDDADPALCDSEEITVTVNEVNLAPELDAIGAQTGDEGTLITFTAAATDADVPAQVLTYSLTGTVPDGAAIDTATGVFTWTPTEAQGPGEFTFTVQVCDSPIEVLCDYEEITVTVNEVNVAPELDAIGAQTGDEGTQITFTATASDVDLPAQVLAFGLVDAPADAEIDELTGFFTWTPADPGLYTLTVQVCDDAVEPLCDTEEITITVGEVIVNTPPVAVADAYSTDQDTELVVEAPGVLANDTDANADALIAEMVLDVANGTLTLAEDGSFTYTPDAGFVGEDSFTYKAFDGVDYSEIVTVTITVNEVAPEDFTLFLPLIMK